MSGKIVASYWVTAQQHARLRASVADRRAAREAELERLRAKPDADVLAPAELLADDTGDVVLRGVIEDMRATLRADRAIDENKLRRAMAAAETRQRKTRAQGYVRDQVLEAFHALGYRPADDPPPVEVPGDALIVRPGTSAEHAVRLLVAAKDINLTPVRLVDPARPTAGSRDGTDDSTGDARVEAVLCADSLRMLMGLGSGIVVGPVSWPPPGRVPMTLQEWPK